MKTGHNFCLPAKTLYEQKRSIVPQTVSACQGLVLRKTGCPVGRCGHVEESKRAGVRRAELMEMVLDFEGSLRDQRATWSVDGSIGYFVRPLFRSFVVTGFAAGLAVHEPVGADADVDHGLAEATKLFTFARAFCTLALHAAILRGTSSGAHATRLARAENRENMTEVISGSATGNPVIF